MDPEIIKLRQEAIDRFDRETLEDSARQHMAHHGFGISRESLSGPVELDKRDILESLADVGYIRSNLVSPNPHPLAPRIAEWTLKRICESLQCRSLNGSDFGSALSVMFRAPLVNSYAASARENDPLFWDVSTKDYKPISFPVADILDLKESPDSPGGMASAISLQPLSTSGGEVGQPYRYVARIQIARSLIVSDDFQLVAAAMAQLGAHAARIEPQRLAAIINSNATVNSVALFGGDNTTSSTGISASSLGEAVGKLRKMTSASGNVLNLPGSVWLVPVEKYVAALGVIAGLTLATGTPPIRVVCNPWLSSSVDSYLLPAPEIAPVFARMRITPEPQLSVGTPHSDYDGNVLVCEYSTGIRAISRNIVKIPG